MTEWSMTSSTGTRGLMAVGSPPSVRQGVAHGRQVDDPGDSGEVLHEHTLGGEGDLGGRGDSGLLTACPSGHRFDVRAWTWRPSSCRRRFSRRTFMA